MSAPTSSVTVVLATYERPEALDVVLHALAEQHDARFGVVVADDGSGDDVLDVVERWRSRLHLEHVWQPKQGFRKARALDLAALGSVGDYLAFLDADCVPRQGFIQAVRRGARPGWFLSTKRIMLGERFSDRVTRTMLPIWRWSALEWLVRAPRELGRPGYVLPVRDRRRAGRARQPDFSPPGLAYSFIGVLRKDFERVNGYDIRFRRPEDGEDQDLANRLARSGLRCGWAGSASTVFHLWHPPRSYQTDSRLLFRKTIEENRVVAVAGLRELAAELADGQVSANRVGGSSSSSDPANR